MDLAAWTDWVMQKRIIHANPPKKSYSQFGEDIQILRMVDSEPRVYWDIGSGHPVLGNNTFALYRRGWQGILVEPIPELAKISKRFRPKDVVINKVISDGASQSKFYRFHPYQYSTTLESQAKKYIASGIRLISTIDIEAVDINSFIGILPDAPTVISIDTEGNDASILKQILKLEIYPTLFCIEDYSPQLSKSFIHSKLSDIGYTLVAWIPPSSIYLLENGGRPGQMSAK